jgi:hypothetical protein
MSLFESDRLFIKAGISDDSGRDLSIIRLNDTDAIFREVLIADVKRVTVDHGLDHRRIQEAESLGGTGDFVSHTLCAQSR